MKVYELAKKLRRSSKEILQAARYLEILVQSHLSSLSDEEVKQIIKYFRKRRLLFFFKRYFSLFLLIFLVTILFFIINPQSVVSGEIDASVNESGELTIDWEFNDSIESGIIFIESESEIFLIEVFEVSGNTVECCYDENLAISIYLTDKDGNEEEIEAKNIEVPDNVSTSTTLSISTTTSSSTTTTTLPECNDEDFKPYTLYDSDGNANTVMSCSNEQDALNSGFIYTVNPKPPPPTTTTTSTTTTTTSTTTTTIPDPSSTVSQSLGSCSGPSGTRTSTLSITNNESYTAYYLVEYSTNSGSSYTTAQTNQSISGGATNTTNTVVVSDGGSIIWRYKDSRTSNDFSIASYVTLSTSDTVDCPDGYYVNVDGSNTYALNVECRKWNDTTKVRFRANPWWGDYDLAKDYMFALIALTGDYDDGDTDVEVEDYFDHSQWSCSVIPGAYFAYEKGFVQFIGQAITAPSWNSTTDVEDGSSNNRDFYVFAEQVP